VKFSTSLEIIGSGSVLLVVGVLMLAFGGAYAFAELTHLPLWACLGLVGLGVMFAGYFLVTRGADETEDQMKHIPVMEAIRSPFLGVGAALAGGFILAALRRSRRSSRPKNFTVVAPSSERVASKQEEGPSLSHLISEQLLSLGTQAASVALTSGWKMLGIPPVEQLLQELLGGENPAEGTDQSRAQPTEPRKSGTNGRHPEPAFKGPNRNDTYLGENL